MKRATIKLCSIAELFLHFNPRPREEGDAFMYIWQFSVNDFNPRPREEGDLPLLYHLQITVISIHALVKRATRRQFLQRRKTRYFNPRPREEGDF